MSKPTENALNAANALLAMGFLRNLKPEHMREAASIIDKHFPPQQPEPVHGIWMEKPKCWLCLKESVLTGPRLAMRIWIDSFGVEEMGPLRVAAIGEDLKPIFEEAVSDGD